MNIMDKINRAQCKAGLPEFSVGDTIKIHTKIKEGDSERIQLFSGIVIARKGSGINESITVRRIAFGQGMERIFPLNSPRIEKIEVERRGRVRRAKLYYLRKKIGKTSRVKDEKRAILSSAQSAKSQVQQPAAPDVGAKT